MAALSISKILASAGNLVNSNTFGFSKPMEWWLRFAETVSEKEIKEYQFNRLRFVAERAFQLPFYKKIFQERYFTPGVLHSPEDLARLPVLYKADFRKYREHDYINFSLAKRRGYWAKTSGSTGEPFRLMRDKKYAKQARVFNLQIFKKFGIDVCANKIDFLTSWGTPVAWGDRANLKILTVDNFSSKMAEYADFIFSFKPIVLESNPSYLTFFARYLAENKKTLCVPYILSYGENLFEKERGFIERIFSAEIINRYGMTEITTIAAECPAHEGLHLNNLGVYVEVVDDGGIPIDDGREGEIVVTSLINEITPVLRYGTGDRGRWIKKKCSCGRTAPLLKMEGRRNDVLNFKNGRMASMHFFHPVFYAKMDKIRQFQIVQESESAITVRIVPVTALSGEDENFLKRELKNVVGPGVRVNLLAENEISWAQSGKYKYIVRL